MLIHWYPGHMTKARRMMEEKLPLVDLVIEVVDARAPKASRNPMLDDLFSSKIRLVILNKADLADPVETKAWTARYRREGWYAMEAVATKGNTRKELMSFVDRVMAPQLRELLEKRGIRKVTRGMLVGIPNVGKSALINCFSQGSAAKVGNRPGVTRGQQLIRVTPYLELLDTPGVLWPKLDDQALARHLAYIGSVKDDVVDPTELACAMAEELADRFPEILPARYGIAIPEKPEQAAGIGEFTRGASIIESIAKKRGALGAGGVPDTERAAQILLTEYRSGRLGKITWEKA